EPFATAELVEVRIGGVQMDRLALVTEVAGPAHGQYDGEHLVDGVDGELGIDRGGGTDDGLGVVAVERRLDRHAAEPEDGRPWPRPRLDRGVVVGLTAEGGEQLV